MSTTTFIAVTGAGSTRRRGVVTLATDALERMGLRAGDSVLLRAESRSTAALVDAGHHDESVLVLDEVVLRNLGAANGASVSVEKVDAPDALELTIELPGPSLPDADLVRALLVDKVVLRGDHVTLLPVISDGANATAVSRASSTIGVGWTTLDLRVTELNPTMARVGASTRVTVTAPPAVASPSALGGTDFLADAMSLIRSARSRIPAPTASASWVPTDLSGLTTPPSPAPAATTAARTTTTTPTTTAPAAARAATVPSAPKLSDLPGLEAQAAALTERLDLTFRHTELLKTLGTTAQPNVLISGPAGSGKRSLVRAVCAELDLELHEISASRVSAQEPSSALRELEAQFTGVVLLADMEKLFPLEATPLSSIALDLMRKRLAAGTVLLATTSDASRLNPEVLRPDVVDAVLSVPTPTASERARVLEVLTRSVPLERVDLEHVASKTPGFVAADLRALVDAAALASAGRRDADPKVTGEDFAAALKVVRASTASSAIEPGGLTLDAVKGVDDVKQALVESVLWPLAYPDTFERLGVDPPRGILLYGPPGCGKTYLVKALAGEGKANVFSIKGAELLSKYVGESEAAVRDVFRRAREAAPSIIFLDEVDSLAPPRGNDNNGTTDRVVASLLTELDGVEGLRGVVVIGATNRPDLVDPALTRPGRLGRMVFLPPPDQGARRDMLKASSKSIPFSGDVDWDDVAARTDGFSAADCSALVTESAMIAMREDMATAVVETSHLEKALESVRPSLDPVQVAQLETYATLREAR